MQVGFQYAFTLVFANEQDRDYYAFKDPAHLEFKDAVREVLEKAVVIDYTPGKF